MGLNRAQILAYPERELPADAGQQLKTLLEQLRSGKPMAYITGCREFWGLELQVTPDVLIPRPETELLVELAINLAPSEGKLIDLGTGSGAIAIAIKTERPDLSVSASDISCAALQVARRNAEHFGVGIVFSQQSWLQETTAQWDMIVSNPPYIAHNDPHLPSLAAEPSQALVSGVDGLRDIHILQTPDTSVISVSFATAKDRDPRSEIFKAIVENGWELLEMKRDVVGLEQVFRQLTTGKEGSVS